MLHPMRTEEVMPKLEAAWRRLPAGAAFSGLTAAWLNGLDVEPCSPIEATVPPRAGVSGRAGVALRRSELNGDVVNRRGVCATSMSRTIADVCGTRHVVEAVVLADAALHKRLIRLSDLRSWATSNPRRHGIRNLRRLLDLVEPAAESPMESRLRMTLVLGGLPRPRAQVSIHDESGRFAGRIDLFYEQERLGIEYDGAIHRDSLAQDNRRQNSLIAAGVTLLRFTAADVLGNPGAVVNQVRSFLRPQTPPGKLRPAPPSGAPPPPPQAAAAK